MDADTGTGEAATAGKPSPVAILATALAETWQRRDRLQDRALTRAGWTPVDYAPHLWREYQELALGIDRRSRAGAAFDPASLAKEIDWNLSLDEKIFSEIRRPIRRRSE